MSRFLPLLLAIACAKSSPPTAAVPDRSPSAIPDPVQQATPTHIPDGGAVVDTDAHPALLEATGSKVDEGELASLYPQMGQLWHIVDDDLDATPGLDGVAFLGAAAFEDAAFVEAGTFGMACVRVRGDILAAVDEELGEVEVYPVLEIVPGTLRTADTHAEAHALQGYYTDSCDDLVPSKEASVSR